MSEVEQVLENAENLQFYCENKGLTVPNIDDLDKRILRENTFKSLNLENQVFHDNRVDKLERIGLKKFDSFEDALSFFLKEKINKKFKIPLKEKYSVNARQYNYHWHVEGYEFMEPIYLKHKDVKYMVAPPNALKTEIPLGIGLLMKELRDHGLVDCFHAIGPTQVFHKPVKSVDPIIVGTIVNHGHFFIGMWK